MEDYMLANFATFIQVLEAFYASMLMDKIFTIWNPVVTNKIEDTEKTFLGKNTNLPHEKIYEVFMIMRKTSEGLKQEYGHSIKKLAVFMLFISSIILLFTCFETYLPIPKNHIVYRTLALTSVICFIFIVICQNKYLYFENKKKKSILYLGYPGVLIVFYLLYVKYDVIKDFITEHVLVISLIIIMLFLIHIIYYSSKFEKIYKFEKKKFNGFWGRLLPVSMNIIHHIDAILLLVISIICSDYIFELCEKYPVYIILGFLTLVLVCQILVSFIIGYGYLFLLSKQLKRAKALIIKNPNMPSEEISEKFENLLIFRYTKVGTYSKFYLLYFDLIALYLSLITDKNSETK